MRVALLARAGIGGILRRKKNKNIKSKKIATVAFADIQSLADNARTVVCNQESLCPSFPVSDWCAARCR